MSASGRPLIHLLREAHARDVLALLADGWKREKNPVYAWNAYNTARLTGLDIPKWVSAYLDAAAAAIMKAVQQAHSGETIGNEAEYVGKALGFGAGGPGQTPQFGELKKLGTDWDLHIEVSELIERGEKIDNAYSIVAAQKKLAAQLSCGPTNGLANELTILIKMKVHEIGYFVKFTKWDIS